MQVLDIASIVCRKKYLASTIYQTHVNMSDGLRRKKKNNELSTLDPSVILKHLDGILAAL